MRPSQACRAVLGAFLLAGAAAQAEDREANQVLLAPGQSVRFIDADNPGINAVVTAPHDAYLNLSRLIAASEKTGIFSIVTAIQIKSVGSIVSNADGSLSLQPASDHPYFVPRNVAPGPGRITLQGGTAVFAHGRTTIHSDSIVQPAAPRARAPDTAVPVAGARNEQQALPTAPRSVLGQAVPSGPAGPRQPVTVQGAITLPVGGSAVGSSGGAMPVNVMATPAIGSAATFNVGQNSSVNVIQPSGGVSLNAVSGGNITIGGTLSTNGNIVIINPAGTVTMNPGTVATGSISISTAGAPVTGAPITAGGAVTTMGSKGLPPPGIVVK